MFIVNSYEELLVFQILVTEFTIDCHGLSMRLLSLVCLQMNPGKCVQQGLLGSEVIESVESQS